MNHRDKKLAKALERAQRLVLVLVKPGHEAQFVVRSDRWGVRRVSYGIAAAMLKAEGIRL